VASDRDRVNTSIQWETSVGLRLRGDGKNLFWRAVPSLLDCDRRPAGTADDQLMPTSKTPKWRDDIDALAFQPAEHQGVCMVHRRAFRTLLRIVPSPRQCVDFYYTHQDAFQAAARAKVARADVADTANFHLTSRDVARQLKN
jgi:hypothetical protein